MFPTKCLQSMSKTLGIEKDWWLRVENCALWFLKLPHSDAKEQLIYNVDILGV
jgi:hypothetical protein